MRRQYSTLPIPLPLRDVDSRNSPVNLHPATVIVGILCCGAIIFADKQTEPILRDINIRLPMTTAYIVQYTHFIATCALLLPIIAEKIISGSGIPLATSILTFVVINLFAHMCRSGSLHHMDFDIAMFLTLGHGVVPILCLLSAGLWARFVMAKLGNAITCDSETPPNPAV